MVNKIFINFENPKVIQVSQKHFEIWTNFHDVCHEKFKVLKTVHRKNPARKETCGTESLWLLTYLSLSFTVFKSILMQISKYPYMFVVI